MAEDMLLSVRSLSGGYGRIKVLHDIDLDIRHGEIATLIGANGAGKTTLLRLLSGIEPASGGSVQFNGHDITTASTEARVSAGIIQAPEGRQIFRPMSVEDNLRLGAYRRGRGGDDAIERIYDLFPVLRDKRALAAGGLSGGQQQMLAIGRALMAEPVLLLLDEPSMGLAPLLVAQIFDVILSLKRAGVTVFLVEQNANAALAVSDRAYVLETGRIVMHGKASEIASNPDIRRAYLGI